MNEISSHSQKFDFLLAQRIGRRQPYVPVEALVVCKPASIPRWQLLGNVIILVPGLLPPETPGTQGSPLIIDEEALFEGPWTNTASATGERRLAQLELVSQTTHDTGGVVVGVRRNNVVPDVNLQRLRSLYALHISPDQKDHLTPEPRLVRKIRSTLDAYGETHDH